MKASNVNFWPIHADIHICINICMHRCVHTHEHMRIPPHAHSYTHMFCLIRKEDSGRSVNGDDNDVTDTLDATENSQDSHCPCSSLKKLL